MISDLSLIHLEAHTEQRCHNGHGLIETALSVQGRMDMLWRDRKVGSRPERSTARTAEVGDLTTRGPVEVGTGFFPQLLLRVSAVTHIWVAEPEPLTAQRERGTSRK